VSHTFELIYEYHLKTGVFMNKIILSMIVFSFSVAFAQDETSKPCLEVKKACELAGFTKGKHKDGKGLYKDCMQKLGSGESVEGVSISADAISACKEKRTDLKEKKK
jgi:hypothetical protein